jgi:hypothetical protein
LRTGNFILIFLFVTIAVLDARDVTVSVEDADLAMPLEGAVVRSEGAEFICGADGTILIPLPSDKTVIVTASYPGYRTERLVINRADAGSNVSERYTISLRLENMLSNRELVFTAERTRNDTRVESGRGVTIADQDLARVSEIGFVEDVMTAVKLLPGVGYTSMFNAMPSIRGGDPGDLIASLDGFYIENPYFWGGGFSIFDPRMIESVKLSHGIFSARYGRTISGLLELTSKKPSSEETEIELGVSTSAVNLNVSVPVNNKGGLMMMGKATYWDGYVALVKALSYSVEELEPVRAVTTAPYIRVAEIAGNYRFYDNLDFSLNGFIGGDGVGARYNNPIEMNGQTNTIDLTFDWDNIQSFAIGALTFNPASSMRLKAAAGGGFLRNYMDGAISNKLRLERSDEFINKMGGYGITLDKDYSIDNAIIMQVDDLSVTAQTRLDYDWEIGKGFLFGSGFEVFYSEWNRSQYMNGVIESKAPPYIQAMYPNIPETIYLNTLAEFTVENHNKAWTNALYTTVEYKNDEKNFGGELGLRLDHLYFEGKDFTIQTIPAFNPRLNIDVTLMRDKKNIDSLTLTAGTGLFSSLTDNISQLQSSSGIDDYELKQNRSWTNLIGANIAFLSAYTFNIEGYYKYIFNRAYTVSELVTNTATNTQTRMIDYHFDGVGQVWGFDLMLQRNSSTLIDGWISYTFNYAKYKNPKRGNDSDSTDTSGWRFPGFHRFHNLNLVLNYKPAKRFNISARFGIASGTPLSVPGEITSYPVLVVRGGGQSPDFIEKYRRDSYYSDTRRNGFSLPLDIKFSFLSFNKNGKARGETYLAIENALSFLKTREQNTSFDAYTGKEVEGSDTASYQLPIPMISFGFTWSY